jgi:hypothetical protein
MISIVKVFSPCNYWNKWEIQNHGQVCKSMGRFEKSMGNLKPCVDLENHGIFAKS